MPRKIQRAIDFNKVQWAEYYYMNQHSDRANHLPTWTSCHCVPFEPDQSAPHHIMFPGETLSDRAIRLNILDRWYPVCVLVFTANKHLRFTGKQATKIWKSYNTHLYGRR